MHEPLKQNSIVYESYQGAGDGVATLTSCMGPLPFFYLQCMVALALRIKKTRSR